MSTEKANSVSKFPAGLLWRRIILISKTRYNNNIILIIPERSQIHTCQQKFEEQHIDCQQYQPQQACRRHPLALIGVWLKRILEKRLEILQKKLIRSQYRLHCVVFNILDSSTCIIIRPNSSFLRYYSITNTKLPIPYSTSGFVFRFYSCVVNKLFFFWLPKWWLIHTYQAK